MLTMLRKPVQEVATMPAVAEYQSGQKVTIPEQQFLHMLIGGENGSGKSGWINSIIANLLHRNFIMWGIDCKGGIELTPWLKRFGRIAENPTDATPMLRDLYDLVEERMQIVKNNRAEKWKDEWGPRYILFIDEVVECLSERAIPQIADFEDKKGDVVTRMETATEAKSRGKNELQLRMEMLKSLASRSRAAGVTLVLATQHPTADVLPSAIKANLVLRVCCKVTSSDALRVILGNGTTEGISPEKIPNNSPGSALIKGFPESGWNIRLARAFYYTKEEIGRAMQSFDYERWAAHWNVT